MIDGILERDCSTKMSFFEELKRRNVLRAAALYAVVGWLILQVGEVTFEPLHFPDWALTTLVILVIIGFPIAMILAWFFDFTWQGFKKDEGPSVGSTGDVSANQAEPAAGGPSICLGRIADQQSGHGGETAENDDRQGDSCLLVHVDSILFSACGLKS